MSFRTFSNMHPILKPVKNKNKCFIWNISITVADPQVKLWQPVQIFNLNKVNKFELTLIRLNLYTYLQVFEIEVILLILGKTTVKK
jgi:hypothetical protein